MNRVLITFLFSAFALLGMSEEQRASIRHLTRQNGLTNDRVTVLEQDHHGYIWAGTENGLNRISGHEVYTWEYPGHPLHNIHVSDIEADEKENCLWIFTPQGLAGCIDLAQNRLIEHAPDEADSLLYFHHKGQLYMWQYGPARRCVRTRINKGRLDTQVFDKEVSDIHTDEEGGDWLLTGRGLYLNGLEEKLRGSDSVTHITTYRNICLAVTPHGVLAYNHSRRVVRRTPFPKTYRNANQCTDLATWGDQLLIFTPEKTIAYHILEGTFSAPTNWQLKNGQTLPQNGKHVYAYDGQGKLMRFGEGGAVHSLQLMPTEVARQSSGRMPQVSAMNATTEAIATYGNGLYLLNVETGKSTHFRQEEPHGFIRDNRIHSLLTDHTGCLWLATEQAGVTCLPPIEKSETQAILSAKNAPHPRINLVVVDGEERLMSTDEMELSYTHNNVEWHFSCMAYDQLDATQYQYYLTGVDSTWQSPTHNHKAIYKDLPPGRYQFHVRASLDGLHWGSEATHTIVIDEPWWSQWPAYLVTLAIFAAMGLFLYFIVHQFIHPERATSGKGQASSGEQQTSSNKGQAPNNEQKEPSNEQQALSNEPQPISHNPQTMRSVTTDEIEKSTVPTLTAKEVRFKQQLEATLAEHIEDTDFTTEQFATLMGLKRTQFYNRVKHITGLSPIELTRKARLEHAAHLLIESDLNIDEVRERCGFTNSTNFYNYFKQHFGMTPRQYRQKIC